MSKYIRSERGDLHDTRWRETGDEYRVLIGRGLTREQAVKLLAAKAGVNRPAIYNRLRRLNVLPQYKPRRQMIHPPSVGTIPGDEIVARRVERDPCGRCGVRADIGCNHHPIRSLSVAVFA